jgi:pheromone shutdown-related protein TraB
MTDDAIPGELIALPGREVRLLGTAHISAESCAEVERAVRLMRPDAVLVELDDGRLANLRDPEAWTRTDIRTVLRQRRFGILVASLVLSSYQRRMGAETGVRPGTELLRAVQVAEELGIPVQLIDRPIRATLRRIWGNLGWWGRMQLFSSLLAGMVTRERIGESELANLRQPGAVGAMLAEMGRGMPALAETLVAERDRWMAERIQALPGARVLVVVGAAHVPGMAEALRAGRRADLAALEADPVRPLGARLVPWLVAAAIIGGIAALVIHRWQNQDFRVLDALRLWILCTSLPAAAAALIARAHLLVVLLVALLAPVATLLRAIPGPKLSLASALLQAWLRPPTVADMEGAADDLRTWGGWWRNRLLRIVLVFALPGLAATAGAIYALARIAAG